MRKLNATARMFGLVFSRPTALVRLFLSTLIPAAALVALGSSAAFAQQQIISPGQLAVTGYSGSTAVTPPLGADPFDYLGIKLDGPSLRVVDVRVLGPQGQLSNATKPFTATASQVGQVFGVTLDNAPRPNIYVAATSAYGLAISILDQNGQQQRVRTGTPGAQWMAGQFGPPALGGGPGSIWKIDGTTGAVSLFANIQNAMLGAASLGGLAFDPRTNQIFAVDRGSGIVHRFGLDGVQRGTYDHGTEGRGPIGLPPIPPSPVAPLNIGDPAFNTENPATWGFATPARRVFALAVYENRLYYSVAQGPQVWSVGISPSGAVAASPRVEVEVPSLQEGVEISSIAFDHQGRMYLAERGATTGDYFRYNLANGGASRVLRYVRKLPGDPTPGLWRLTPEQYSVGLPPNYANADGGIALGYAYNQDNVIDFNTCGATLWSTGERLLDPGDPAAPPDSYPNIDGLQGNAINLIQPQNTPPLKSWFIDYDDLNGDPNYRGHVGAAATLPCPGATPVLPPPPQVSCPPGTFFSNGQCLIIPECPAGTYYSNGKCYYVDCPPGYVMDNGQCKPPPVVCPAGTFFYQGQCLPISCPPGLVMKPNGQCGCPPGNIFFNGQCVPPQNCPPGLIELPGGICWCPLGTIFNDGLCQPNTCPPGQVWQNGFCKPCANNKDFWNGQCVPKCPPGEVHLGPQGVCGSPPGCPPGQEKWNGQCKPKCGPGQVHQPPFGFCGPGGLIDNCPPDQEKWNGQCKPKCGPGQVHQPPFGFCGPGGLIDNCPPDQEKWNGQCKPKCGPGQVHLPPFGLCGPGGLTIKCPPDQEKWNGQCKPKCGPGQEHKPPTGACGPAGPGGLIGNCPPGEEQWNGQCKPKCAPDETRLPNGICIKKPSLKLPGLGGGGAPPPGPGGAVIPPGGLNCLPPLQNINGECRCPGLQILKDGKCEPIQKLPVPGLKLPGLLGNPQQPSPPTPPEPEPPVKPIIPLTPPGGLVAPQQPSSQVKPGIIQVQPNVVAPTPKETPPSQEPSPSDTSSAPPASPPSNGPELKLPGQLKSLRQLKTAPAPQTEAGTPPPDDKTTPETPETETPAQVNPNLNLQLQNMAPAVQ